jgi:hypothetical protein
MTTQEKVDKIQLDLSCAYLEANDLPLRIEEINILLEDPKVGKLFKHQAKQTLNKYNKASKELIKVLEAISDKISNESKEDDKDNYKEVLNDLHKGLKRLDVALVKIVKNEK